MSLYRRISIRMWGDAKFCSLSSPQPNAQTLWMYLLTGEYTTAIPGVVRAGEAAMAEALGWSLKAFKEAFLEISTKGMAKADWRARLAFLPKALSHNPPQSPKVVVAWHRAFDELPDCDLRNEIGASIEGYLSSLPEAFRKGFPIALPDRLSDRQPDIASETEAEAENSVGSTPTGESQEKAGKSDYDTWFVEHFIPAYPLLRRVQDKGALAQLRRTKPDEAARAAILARLGKWKLSAEWVKDGGQYIPGMAKFLQDAKYQGDPPPNGKP